MAVLEYELRTSRETIAQLRLVYSLHPPYMATSVATLRVQTYLHTTMLNEKEYSLFKIEKLKVAKKRSCFFRTERPVSIRGNPWIPYELYLSPKS